MTVLESTRLKVIVKIGIEEIVVWEGFAPQKPIIAAARICASELTLYVGDAEDEEPKEEGR